MQLINTKQAAEMLGIRRATVRRLIREGRLNAFKIAGKGKYLLDEKECIEMLTPTKERNTAHLGKNSQILDFEKRMRQIEGGKQ